MAARSERAHRAQQNQNESVMVGCWPGRPRGQPQRSPGPDGGPRRGGAPLRCLTSLWAKRNKAAATPPASVCSWLPSVPSKDTPPSSPPTSTPLDATMMMCSACCQQFPEDCPILVCANVAAGADESADVSGGGGAAAASLALAGPAAAGDPATATATAAAVVVGSTSSASTSRTSSASAGCGHYFCAGCMSEYVRGAVRERKYPVLCPMASGGGVQGGCKHRLSRDVALALLDKHPQEQQAFELLEAESALGVPGGRKLYCPHADCSSPLLLAAPEDVPSDGPTTCPACWRAFCPRCLSPGWHPGISCATFQSLPPEERSGELGPVLALGAERGWRRCPGCRALVERNGGCNHMSCRCGKHFCYGCGCAYISSKPTRNNQHGTQGCQCPLWARG